MPALDNEVGEVVGTVGDIEYRQVLLNPVDGTVHVTPDGRTWVAVHEGVVNGEVVTSPFTIHWKGPSEAAQVQTSLESFGPSASQLDEAQRELLQNSVVTRFLGDARFQVLSFILLDPDIKSDEPVAPNRVRLALYDYTNNRTVVINSQLATAETIEIAAYGSHELPVREEFDAAVRLLAQQPELGPGLLSGDVSPYQPMPPLIPIELPDGRIERNIAVGLRGGDIRHRIVGVNLNRPAFTIDDVPDAPLPSNLNCGPPADDSCPASGSAQRARVTISQGSTVLWTFQVTRPAASSGTNGSGIELRNVRYRGKQVLYQAHVPILNIQYLNATGGCGPTYRDWQNQENCFQATGSDPLPGFRLCSSPATTIFDTGSDSGNFRGVAIYTQGPEVVLVSELQAGWYRYISSWRFHADGTIRPRFAFGATDNACTCKAHHHHVYWRFDFDIETAANNLVEEFNDPILIGSSNWHKKVYEIRRPRDISRKRKWKVSNTVTGAGYELIPGPNDGNADAYGLGDLWVLRYKPTEIDDGQGFTTNAALSMAHLDTFRSPAELVENQDVVLWYSGHFLHDEAHPGGQPHIIGPDLKPVNW